MDLIVPIWVTTMSPLVRDQVWTDAGSFRFLCRKTSLKRILLVLLDHTPPPHPPPLTQVVVVDPTEFADQN
jgi:hypothetical protein